VNYYDNGVRQADAVIGELLAQLADKGYLSRAVVVVTADHGELLGEHGLYTHARGVYEEVLRVPFVFMSFGYRPAASIVDTVQGALVDIAPTMLRALDLAIPSSWVGVPLQDSHQDRVIYFQEGSLAGLYDCRTAGHCWKYYVDMRSGGEFVTDFLANPNDVNDAHTHVDTPLMRQWRGLVLPTVRGPG
jgi:hypothetical protein